MPLTSCASKRISLSSYSTEVPQPQNFFADSVLLPDLKNGEILVQTLYLSVDPYMRGLLNPTGIGGNYPFFKLGETIVSGGVGRVVASLNEQFKPGDYVEGAFPWQEQFIADSFVDKLPWLGRGDRTGIRKLSYGLEHISDAIGLYGMPGLTAYFAIQTAQIKPGDRLVVSSAGGAVGSLAGQLAKLKGATVVGLTSSAKKAEFLTQELKFDHVLNYKSTTFAQELTAIVPAGVDVYLESVGGRVGEIVMNQLKERTARIVLIGMVSTYNDDLQSGYINVWPINLKSATMRGSMLYHFEDQFPQTISELEQLKRDGKIRMPETILEGLEKAPTAFEKLFAGQNLGKLIIKVS